MATTSYLKDENEHLLFLLPGQSLSPRAFWDFTLPDGKTHTQYFLEEGIDVIHFDPVGYGKSTEFYEYDRIGFAAQIKAVTDTITKKYKSKTILGFSSTTAPALIAAEQGFFDRVIIHSPCVRDEFRFFIEHDYLFLTDMDRLKSERIAKVSDRLIPKSNKLDGWEQAVIDIVGKDSWCVPAKVVYDINNFWCYNGHQGFHPEKTPPILVIKGEYDFEVTGGGYDVFKRLFPCFIEETIPNSTHFSMWENNSPQTRRVIINWCLTN
jgi:pimeloyl-ACP methyl ester carboxylesterase